jgi:hypothetical protein
MTDKWSEGTIVVLPPNSEENLGTNIDECRAKP